MTLPADFNAFRSSLTQTAPNPDWPEGLKSLWYDGKGDWASSHDIAQDMPGNLGSRIHGYLHRKEGDPWNAGYWYRQAGCEFPAVSLEKEWEELVRLVIG